MGAESAQRTKEPGFQLLRVLHVRCDFGLYLVFGQVSGDAFLDFAALEEHEGGNAHDAVLHHDVGIQIRIQLDDLDLAAPFTGELFDDGCDHFARLTPVCRKIHQYGGFCADDFILKVLFGYIFN